jgi:hypothetical protein
VVDWSGLWKPNLKLGRYTAMEGAIMPRSLRALSPISDRSR